jgi:GMP synthase-like glutamine amidotransferase
MTVLGILECGRNKPEWLEEHGGFAEWFPPLLNVIDPTLTFKVWRADQGELPDRVDACDAWLLTGSPASTYQDLPWQRGLSAFVVETKDVRPMIGVCYGHQHIHAALGGTVEKAAQWGVGITRYGIDARPEWLKDTLAKDVEEFRLIALHQDHVTVPAPDTRVLASSPQCPFAITLIGSDVLTFQPHPEMTPEQAAKIYDLHRGDMGEAHWSAAQQSLRGDRDHQLAARWIVDFIRSTARLRNASENGEPKA